jgi:hypothetical protein
MLGLTSHLVRVETLFYAGVWKNGINLWKRKLGEIMAVTLFPLIGVEVLVQGLVRHLIKH